MKSEARNPNVLLNHVPPMNSPLSKPFAKCRFSDLTYRSLLEFWNSFVIRHSSFVILFTVLLLGSQPCSWAAEPLKALLITGGCCHDYEAQKKIISEGISARANVNWTIVHEGDAAAKDHKFSIYEKPDWAKGFDVVVHNECSGRVTNVTWVEHIAKAHFDGVPAVVIHCSIHSYRESTTDEWRKLLGVSSYRHQVRRPFEIVAVKPEHPVMKGFPSRWQD